MDCFDFDFKAIKLISTHSFDTAAIVGNSKRKSNQINLIRVQLYWNSIKLNPSVGMDTFCLHPDPEMFIMWPNQFIYEHFIEYDRHVKLYIAIKSITKSVTLKPYQPTLLTHFHSLKLKIPIVNRPFHMRKQFFSLHARLPARPFRSQLCRTTTHDRIWIIYCFVVKNDRMIEVIEISVRTEDEMCIYAAPTTTTTTLFVTGIMKCALLYVRSALIVMLMG